MQTLKPWQHSLANSITELNELCKLIQLNPSEVHAILGKSSFPLRVSREFVARIERGNSEDPLLKQILPVSEELIHYEGYSCDPLEEKSSNPVPGLLHKYQSRVLLTVASACAINCRFCFRRHFPYSENNPGTLGWKDAIEYIAADPKIEEVIFSGGDPLVLKDQQLGDLARELSQIPHLKRLRIHTRLPIMIPSRINEELLEWLTGTSLQPVIVIHCNHPNELDQAVIAALHTLRSHQVSLLNQSVLLKGVNDTIDTLIKLNQLLFSSGVLPYYLHLLDPVEGTAHFAVSESKAVELIQEMTHRLSGYLVPKLVREIAGNPSKLSMMPRELGQTPSQNLS